MLIILFFSPSISSLMFFLISLVIAIFSALFGLVTHFFSKFLILRGLLYQPIFIISVSRLLSFVCSTILIVSQLPSNISSILTIHIFWLIFSTPPLLICIFYPLPSFANQAMLWNSIDLLIFSPILVLCFDFHPKYWITLVFLTLSSTNLISVIGDSTEDHWPSFWLIKFSYFFKRAAIIWQSALLLKLWYLPLIWYFPLTTIYFCADYQPSPPTPSLTL